MSLTILGQAYSTMNQLQQKLDTVSHNIANADTTGYKARKAEFSSLLFQQVNNMTDPRNAEGRLTPDGIRVGSGARLGSIQYHSAIGSIKTTDRRLDTMLINENHFYEVAVTDGANTNTYYTRDGAFYLHPINDDDMLLVTKDGHPVLGADGPIQINGEFDAVDINTNGDIVVTRGTEQEVVGRLSVVQAIRPRLLEAAGDNFFRLPDLDALGLVEADIIQATGENDRLIESGVLESSNVNMAEEMTDMIVAQRAYQFNARSITMADQMQGLINQIRT